MKRILPLLLSVTLSACMATTYEPITDQAYETNALERKVEFKVSDALYDHMPDCVVVWPLGEGGKQAQNIMIESAIARHLSGKVERVIGPRQRDKLARASAFDLVNSRDRQSFARAQRCSYGVTAQAAQAGTDYLVVWAQHQVGLDLSLSHTESSTELWRARHVGRRGHGGLPLSPISVGLNMFEAGSSSTDEGQLPSLVDDALRRMMVTLPDLRW